MNDVVYENDLLTCGKIVALRVLKEEKDNGSDLNDVDFDYLIEIESRNLNNLETLDTIEKLPEGGE